MQGNPQTERTAIRHGRRSPHYGKLTLIPVPESFGLCASRYTAPNDVCDVPAFLYCRLSYFGHQHRRPRLDAEYSSNRSNEMSGVTDGKGLPTSNVFCEIEMQ
jgi:hypothetical protein